jgi:hypothetical protein
MQNIITENNGFGQLKFIVSSFEDEEKIHK